MKDFRNLKVWEKSHSLALDAYKTTVSFPTSELYGLTSQIRRSATSIPSNNAEGCGRQSDAEPARFLHIAMGSASELEYQMLLSHDLKYIPDVEYQKLNSNVTEIKRMLTAFIQTLKADR